MTVSRRPPEGLQPRGAVLTWTRASSISCKSLRAAGGRITGKACSKQWASPPPRRQPEVDDATAFRMNQEEKKWLTNVRQS